MKKSAAVLLALTLSLLLLLCACGCGENGGDGTEQSGSFDAEITLVNESSILVEPDENAQIRSSSDSVEVDLSGAAVLSKSGARTDIGALRVKQTVRIRYTGAVTESYPAQVTAVQVQIVSDGPDAQTEESSEDTALQSGMEITGSLPFTCDLNGDGEEETVALQASVSDESGDEMYMLTVTGGGSVASDDLQMRGDLAVWLREEDGGYDLFVSGESAEQEPFTVCCRYASGRLQRVSFTGEVRAEHPDTSFVSGAVTQLSPDGVCISSVTHMLGAYTGTRWYVPSGGGYAPEAGKPWAYTDNTNWLTVMKELPTAITGGSSSIGAIQLPVGTRILMTGSDGASRSYFRTEDGAEGYIEVRKQGSGWTIGGVSAADYFDYLPDW